MTLGKLKWGHQNYCFIGIERFQGSGSPNKCSLLWYLVKILKAGSLKITKVIKNRDRKNPTSI